MTTDVKKTFRWTAAEFLASRRDWLAVKVVPSGDGFDIHLRVDGIYSDENLANEAADGIRQMVEAISDVPKESWYGW